MDHLVVLSFEHRRGNQIDSVYPPFPDEPFVADWNQGLPFIAIPDKAHGACSSTIQFTLPNPKLPGGYSYGIAAYRSFETSELAKADPSYKRDHVQRAICVVSHVPLFGELEKPLKKLIFDHFDSLVEDIQQMYDELKQIVSSPIEFSGISYATLFQSLQANVLSLIKALVLRKEILIFADNAELVSKMCVALASLLPGYYQKQPYPLTFLECGTTAYSFAPYVPLQFTETLNNSGSKSRLMGTCSELFMDQKIVDYDILVNCRTMPATITGLPSVCNLQPNEQQWMKGFLKYLQEHWAEEGANEWVRKQIQIWSNSLLASIWRVRHIREVPVVAWKFLDWSKTEVFGKELISQLMKREEIIEMAKGSEQVGEIDETLLVSKKKINLRFW